MTTIATVCARAGSVGLPDKNIRRLNGEPLIERAIRIAFEAGVDDVVVTTDYRPGVDFEPGNAKVVARPAGLAGPDVSKWPVIRHAVQEWEGMTGDEADRIVDVDVTRPLRTAETVRRVVDGLDTYPAIMAVSPANKHPAFDIVVDTPEDGMRPYDDDFICMARQHLPTAYFHAGAYGFLREDLLFTRRDLYDGPVGMVLVDRLESFDIDDALDWQIVEFLDRQRLPTTTRTYAELVP